MGKLAAVQFEEIAARAVAEAEAVPCTRTQFLDGLESIETAVRERLEAEHGR